MHKMRRQAMLDSTFPFWAINVRGAVERWTLLLLWKSVNYKNWAANTSQPLRRSRRAEFCLFIYVRRICFQDETAHVRVCRRIVCVRIYTHILNAIQKGFVCVQQIPFSWSRVSPARMRAWMRFWYAHAQLQYARAQFKGRWKKNLYWVLALVLLSTLWNQSVFKFFFTACMYKGENQILIFYK